MKYSKEILQEVVSTSKSVSESLRKLNLSPNGGMHQYITKLIKKFDINTSHFLGRRSNLGKVTNRRKDAESILVYGETRREKTHQLKRAMLEKGIPHICSQCKIDAKYNGKELTLQIDHVNGNWKDNNLENLRFMCPNCHSQTETFGVKNYKKP